MLLRRVTLVFLLLLTVTMSSAGAQTNKPAWTSQDDTTRFEIAQGYVEVTNYLDSVKQHDDFVAYLTQVQDQVNAYLQSMAPPPPPPPTVQQYTAPPSSGNVGGCTGFSIPDYIIQRESGGDPNAVNPSSGAYGCSQTLPSHYQSGGACAGLDMYSVDGQRQCTAVLSNGGTNLAPWAETS